jgi:uracil-DNA glycosylase
VQTDGARRTEVNFRGGAGQLLDTLTQDDGYRLERRCTTTCSPRCRRPCRAAGSARPVDVLLGPMPTPW